MMLWKIPTLALALIWVTGCSQSEIHLTGTQDVSVDSSPLGDATALDSQRDDDWKSVERGADGQEPKDLGLDQSATDTSPQDGAPIGPGSCAPGEGCFEESCESNEDCLSGWCVDKLGDQVCTQTCQEACPQGWQCQEVQSSGGDVAFICVSLHTHLCRPCVDSDGCKSSTGVEDVCVDYGEGGNFCGSPCAADQDCPPGFSCQDAPTTSGGTSSQCVLDEGLCPCSEKAMNLALQTLCSATGEGGTCVGTKTCTPQGLSQCSVSEPAEETCNGIDDDCDGETDEGSCDDEDPCTEELCDGQECVFSPLTGAPCDDGTACSIEDHCDTGFCLGKGIDCNDQDPCTVDLCDSSEGCVHTATGAACDDGDACTIDDACTAEGCVGLEQACECLVDLDCADLEDGDPCTGSLVCDTNSLPFTCVTDQESVIHCELPDSPNSFCKASWCEATSASCFTGLNNEGLSCDDGDACTVGEGCAQGQCTGSVPLLCDDLNPCTENSCDPATGCVHTPIAGPCDDEDACTVEDLCLEGACVAGPSPDCDDLNPCTSNTCDPATGCLNLSKAGFCDDGDLCTTLDKCVGGSCTGTSPFNCDDNNPCTDNICDAGFGCYFPSNADQCDDSDPCTVGEICVNKVCAGGAPLDCEDGNECTESYCLATVGCQQPSKVGLCDDGDPCTANDACQGPICTGVSLVDCDDGDPCTEDQCTENLGCVHPLNTAPCEDGNFCTVDDTCAGGVCVPGGAPICEDGNPCTTALCDPEKGCTTANNTSGCDDGNVCTLVDVCSAGACVGSGALSCDDQNPCTTDLCDPDDGCKHVIVANDCDDGDPCTVSDTCLGTQCVGVLKDCSDINPCTEDICDENGVCLHPSNTAECDDLNPCTTIDYCLNAFCVGTEPLQCDDDNPCTEDICDHASGCVHPANVNLCDDDDPCSTLSKCQNKACVGVTFKECEDGNPCTDNICVTGVGCQASNNTYSCDDAKACTSNDHCQDGVCTGQASVDVCNDNNPCTTDSCADQGGCTYEMNSMECDDGDPCSVADVCGAGQCKGQPMICEADGFCTDSSCVDGVCQEEIVGSCCGNGEIDPGETCDDGNQSDGDGCPGDCLLGSCPPGTASLHGYCWVLATSLAQVDSGHAEACASIGKAKTEPQINIPWDSQTLADVASQLGYTSVGTYACCAHAMWCNASQGTCGTHGLGGPFNNYGPYADSNWWPIYTCSP